MSESQEIFNSILYGVEFEFLIKTNLGVFTNTGKFSNKHDRMMACTQNTRSLCEGEFKNIFQTRITELKHAEIRTRGGLSISPYEFHIEPPPERNQQVFKWQIVQDFTVHFTEEPLEQILSNEKADYIHIEEIEIISPPLSIIHDNDVIPFMLHEVFPCNKGIIYFRNNTTSNHVHMTCGAHFKKTEVVLKICMAWLYFENVFMMLVESNRRNNDACASLQSIQKIESLKTEKETGLTIQRIFDIFTQDFSYKKNVSLNIENLIGTLGTIECRLKEASKDAKDLMMWVYLLGVFYTRCIENDLYDNDDKSIFTFKIDKEDKATNYQDAMACGQFFFDFINVEKLKEYWGPKFLKNIGCTKNSFLEKNENTTISENTIKIYQVLGSGNTKINNCNKRKTTQKIKTKYGDRVVYLGKKNGKYIKVKGEYKLISRLKL